MTWLCQSTSSHALMCIIYYLNHKTIKTIKVGHGQFLGCKEWSEGATKQPRGGPFTFTDCTMYGWKKWKRIWCWAYSWYSLWAPLVLGSGGRRSLLCYVDLQGHCWFSQESLLVLLSATSKTVHYSSAFFLSFFFLFFFLRLLMSLLGMRKTDTVTCCLWSENTKKKLNLRTSQNQILHMKIKMIFEESNLRFPPHITRQNWNVIFELHEDCLKF